MNPTHTVDLCLFAHDAAMRGPRSREVPDLLAEPRRSHPTPAHRALLFADRCSLGWLRILRVSLTAIMDPRIERYYDI